MDWPHVFSVTALQVKSVRLWSRPVCPSELVLPVQVSLTLLLSDSPHTVTSVSSCLCLKWLCISVVLPVLVSLCPLLPPCIPPSFSLSFLCLSSLSSSRLCVPLLTLQCCPSEGGVSLWAGRVLHEKRQKPQRVSLHGLHVSLPTQTHCLIIAADLKLTE